MAAELIHCIQAVCGSRCCGAPSRIVVTSFVVFSYPYSRRKRSITGARCTDMSLLAVHVSVACQGCIYYERLTVGVLWLRHLRSAYLSEIRGGLYRGSAVYAPLSLRDGRSSKHWAVGRLESRGAAVPKQGNTKFGKHAFTYSVPCVRSWGNFCLASRKQAG